MIRISTPIDYRASCFVPTVPRQQIFARASQLTHCLAQYVRARRVSDAHFDDVEAALSALPLATEDFSVARCRLRNARRLAGQGEFGAACYELRLLARSLFSTQPG